MCVTESTEMRPIKRSESKNIKTIHLACLSVMLSLTKPLLAIIFFFFSVVLLSSVGFIYYNAVPVVSDELVPSTEQIERLLSKSVTMYPHYLFTHTHTRSLTNESLFTHIGGLIMLFFNQLSLPCPACTVCLPLLKIV